MHIWYVTTNEGCGILISAFIIADTGEEAIECFKYRHLDDIEEYNAEIEAREMIFEKGVCEWDYDEICFR